MRRTWGKGLKARPIGITSRTIQDGLIMKENSEFVAEAKPELGSFSHSLWTVPEPISIASI